MNVREFIAVLQQEDPEAPIEVASCCYPNDGFAIYHDNGTVIIDQGGDEVFAEPNRWAVGTPTEKPAKVPPTAGQNIAAVRRAKALGYGEQR
jgi:hypothetical protein